MKKYLLAVAAIMLGLATANVLLMAPAATSNADSMPSDQSQCQYPNRPTNPAGGCDNSDPCDPADAAKGGSGDCLPQSSTQEPVSPQSTPVESKQSVPQSGCKL